MESSLSIYSQEAAVNEDIIVTYEPSDSVIKYEYTIIKDSTEFDSVRIKKNQSSNILLTETGTYQIVIIEYYSSGSRKIVTGKYVIDKEPPLLNIKNKTLNLKKGETIDVMNGVEAIDNIDGNITSSITTNIDDLDLNHIGDEQLVYTVSDNAGNSAYEYLTIHIQKNNSYQLFISQIFLLIISFTLFIYVIKYTKSLKIESRLSRYSVKSIKDKNKTLLDGLYNICDKLIYSIEKGLNKSYLIKKHSKRYQKYISVFGKENDTTVTFVAKKILMSFFFLFLSIISKSIRSEVLQIYEMIIPLFVGYYFLDVLYEYNYRVYRKKIENDFLQAIIIMNNAFKSGRSITQAVELVSTELHGPIAEEFKKMALEISFGLDIEVVFRRLSERVKLEEAVYLTSSLSITNKTGGNITKVFDSIEKNLFNRRKLKIELKSLTGSSKIIIYVLAIVPLFFVAIIGIINPDYFSPMFTNPIGLILIGIMIIIYISYIAVIRKIVNIRM